MPSVTVTRLAEDGSVQTGGEEQLALPGAKWLDVTDADEALLTRLGAQFGIHRLAIEDCLHLDQRPKLEEYPNHLFIVLHSFAVDPGKDLCDPTLNEVHLILGKEFLISVHELPNPGIPAVAARIKADPLSFTRGPDFVAYMIADALVDEEFPILDAFNDELDTLEERIFERPDKSQLQRIFELKRALLLLRRVLSPQRDVVGLLARSGLPFTAERTAIYFRDVYDHLIRVYEQLEGARDMLTGVTDAYLSMVANRTNDITKQLTIFATIFLPLSFITGFFGQNFEVLSHRGFFWGMIALVAIFPLTLVVWFRRNGWL